MKMSVNENDNNTVIEDESMDLQKTNALKYEPVVEKIIVIEDECNKGRSSNIPLVSGSAADDHHRQKQQQEPPIGRTLNNIAAPSFLMKTFTMVEDPKTNNLISWNVNGESFIVWDHNVFASELLPKNFKHNHFSSFIYQLNNYGFRKIETDRWEYYHKFFRAKQPHLLGSIKRRLPSCKRKDDTINKLQAEIAKQKAQNNFARMELEKLKQKQENTEIYKKQVQEALDSAMKWFKNPLVDTIHQVMEQMMKEKRGREEAECSVAKKPRLKQEVEATSQTPKEVFLEEPYVAYEKLLMDEGSDEDDWAFRAMTDDDVFDVKSRIFIEYQNVLGNQLNDRA